MEELAYQLWSYDDYCPDICKHTKIAEQTSHIELGAMMSKMDSESSRMFISDESPNRNYYIRRAGEPTYLIYNIDYKHCAHLFRVVYSEDECEFLKQHLERNHAKYNTRMTTIVTTRDDSAARGEACQKDKAERTKKKKSSSRSINSRALDFINMVNNLN